MIEIYLNKVKNGDRLSFEELQEFINNEDAMIELVKIDSEYIIFYEGNDEEVFQAALSNGFELTKEHIKSVSRSSIIMKKAIETNKDYIKYYTGDDISVYLKAMQYGYKLSLREIRKFTNDPDKMKEIIKFNPEYITNYMGGDESLYQFALDNGFELTSEHIKECQFSSTIMKKAIDIDIDYVKYYIGNDISVFIYAINKGYEMTREDFKLFEYNDNAMRQLIELNPNYIIYYKDFNEELFQLALNKGFEITKEHLIECATSSIIFKKAIEIDVEYIKYYKGHDISVYIDAIKLGYELKEKEFLKFLYNKEDIIKILEVNPNYIKYYNGEEEEVYSFALNNNLEITEEIVKSCPTSTSIMLKAIKIDKNYIKFYKGNNEEVYLKAIEYGYEIEENDFKNNPLLSKMDSVMEKVIKKDPNLIIYYQGDNIEKLSQITNFSKNIPWTAIRFYKGDIKRLIINYDIVSNFLKLLNIKEDLFIQYSLGTDYNWLEDIIKITKDEKISEFIKVNNYFINNIFTNTNNNAQNIKNFILILENYNKYQELTKSIVNNNVVLTEEEKRKIKYLFTQKDILLDEEKPKNLKDFANIHEMIKRKYIKLLEKSNSLYTIKNIICNILFSSDMTDIQSKLYTYGSTMELIKLAFNDRKSPIIPEMAYEMIEYTSMMESIINSNEREYLIEVLTNLLNNFELAFESTSIFNEMNEKMRILYESDIQEMLTSLKNNKLMDIAKTDKYGVLTYDLSDKEYILLAHVIGENEDIDNLCKGISTGNSNFISFSSISYRNQFLYQYETEKIVFGYDIILDDSFICSSLENMVTNISLSKNNSEVGELVRRQRGILETSFSKYNTNNEYLFYRQGLKPSCIIIPGNRKPTEKEIMIAKEYNLKLVITQNIKERIDRPEKIEDKKETIRKKNNEDIETLKRIKGKLIPPKKNTNNPRKIAIFTDLHGLFEPTLAILENIRKEGITEIYSLGDNIGTGPNPSEVLDLIEKYNVKSIMGNHELYAIEGVGKFKDHLDKTGSYHKALNNSVWTNEHITASQKEKIKMYPRAIELILGGKKLLLCHSIKSFNTDKIIVNPKEFDKVLQGHIHFKSEEDNIKTLGGAGIGTGKGGHAYYLVLTEKPEGGYEIEERNVKYDIDNLEEDINTSDLNNYDREKITKWAGIPTRKKR